VTPQPVPHLNVSSRQDRGAVTAAIRKRIDERTAVDRELYESAVLRSQSRA